MALGEQVGRKGGLVVRSLPTQRPECGVPLCEHDRIDVFLLRLELKLAPEEHGRLVHALHLPEYLDEGREHLDRILVRRPQLSGVHVQAHAQQALGRMEFTLLVHHLGQVGEAGRRMQVRIAKELRVQRERGAALLLGVVQLAELLRSPGACRLHASQVLARCKCMP